MAYAVMKNRKGKLPENGYIHNLQVTQLSEPIFFAKGWMKAFYGWNMNCLMSEDVRL